MPLIHDNPWLVDQLLQSVCDEEERLKLFKKGQATPAASTNPEAEALKTVLFNLRDQITPLQKDPGKVGELGGAASLSSEHMDSMGDLVKWLSTNKVPMGNQIIVYPGNINRPSEEYGYYKIEPGTEIVVPLSKPDRTVVAYWINPNALKSYLVSLQSDPKLKTNVIFQVQLLKLIQDANKQLDTDISEEYKEPEKELPENQEVDRFPKIIESFDNLSQPGSEPLLYGNIKSLETLNAWLGQKGIGIKAGDKTLTLKDQAFDLCGVINYMYGRATLLYQRRTTESGPIMQAYMKKMTEIAKQSGCQLTAPSQKPGQQQQQGQEGGGGLSAVSPQILVQLSSLRPFNSQFISFPEISKFLDLYAKYANDANVTKMANDLNDYIKMYKNQTGMGSDTIQLYNLTTDQFKSQLKDPSRATIAANTLYDIIQYAGQLYQRLVNSLQTIAQDPERSKYIDYRAMQQQVTPGGPQLTNINTLNRLKFNLDQEWRNRR